MNQLRKRNYKVGISASILIKPVEKSHISICSYIKKYIVLFPSPRVLAAFSDKGSTHSAAVGQLILQVGFSQQLT